MVRLSPGDVSTVIESGQGCGGEGTGKTKRDKRKALCAEFALFWIDELYINSGRGT